jgi:hypothetical protein
MKKDRKIYKSEKKINNNVCPFLYVNNKAVKVDKII